MTIFSNITATAQGLGGRAAKRPTGPYRREAARTYEPASTHENERNSRAMAEIANERFVAALDAYFRNGGRA